MVSGTRFFLKNFELVILKKITLENRNLENRTKIFRGKNNEYSILFIIFIFF